MNKIRLYFLLDHPFNKRDYDRFGINILLKENFHIEVWDFTPFLFPKVYKNYSPSDKYTFNGLRVFSIKRKALTALAKLNENDIVISYINNSIFTFSIFKIISDKKLYYGFSKQNTIPFLALKKNFIQRVISNWKRLHEVIYYRIPIEFLGIRHPNFIIAGGNNILKDIKYFNSNETEIIWSHSLDYDIFLDNESNIDYFKISNFYKKPYFLFLDEYQPFHSDYLYSKNPPQIDPDIYYLELDRFFSFIENEKNCEVIIAAHPRSQYEKHPDYFNGRKCIKGDTFNLVKNASCIILHCSTAINFAVLFKKPLIFIKSAVIDEWFGPAINHLSSFFNKRVIEIDKPCTTFDLKIEDQIKIEDYNRYKSEYIKLENSENLNSWIIFSRHIKSKFHQA